MALPSVSVMRIRRGQWRRLLVVNRLHVFVEGRPAVEGGRTDRAAENHFSDLHDVSGGAVLFGVTLGRGRKTFLSSSATRRQNKLERLFLIFF